MRYGKSPLDKFNRELAKKHAREVDKRMTNKTAEEIATEFVNQFSFVPRETIDLVEELAGSINQHHQSHLQAIIEKVEGLKVENDVRYNLALLEVSQILSKHLCDTD